MHLCLVGDEVMQHLFIHCEYVISIWRYTEVALGIINVWKRNTMEISLKDKIVNPYL